MGIALYRVHAAFAMVNIAVTFLPSLFSSFSPPSFSFFPLRLFLALSREDYPSGDLTQVVNTGSSSLFAFFPSFSRFLRECDSFYSCNLFLLFFEGGRLEFWSRYLTVLVEGIGLSDSLSEMSLYSF